MLTNIAHRGARSLAPENTLAAARKAHEVGAELWETDIAITRDDVLVLFHDQLPGRTTNAARVFPKRKNHPLCEFTYAECRQLDAGEFFERCDPFGTIRSGTVGPEELHSYRGERIPSLLEALQLTRHLDWSINLELKALPEAKRNFPMVDSVLECIDQIRFPVDHLVISSFYHPWLRQIQLLQPEIQLQALIGACPGDPLDWGGYEFPVYNARSTSITSTAIQLARSHGVLVNLFTVNDPKEMQRFIQAGASGLITDYPQKLKRINDLENLNPFVL